MVSDTESIRRPSTDPDVDVVVVGAGMAGMYLLHRLRGLGLSARGFEAADDVGGTWYWNRYPGARCDVMSIDYSYSFDPQLDEEWEWSEKHATQPEILRYLQHVADKHDLRRDISFSTRIDHAEWDDEATCWRVRTDHGDDISCRHYVMATGCLSQPKELDIAGADRFGGEMYWTSRWPHDGVDFTGRRVAVIGTGSSGIQSIPLIAQGAAALTVYQRTPNFSVPAHNGPPPPEKVAALAADRDGYREAARWSRGGVPTNPAELSALQVSAAEREATYEAAWQAGELFRIVNLYNDIGVNPVANATLADFIRNKIRGIVDDPETAELLCPTDHPFGTKRPCLDSGYYETFNRDHVDLIDLRTDPIVSITEHGIDTTSGSRDFDAIVFATGFDAMTGAIVAVDIRGRGGVKLNDVWSAGPQTYLGLTAAGFPNMFMITGPQSPSVLSNMAVSIEQHVDWVCDAIADLRAQGFEAIEPTETAQAGWVQHVNDFGAITLFNQADSWYMGANVPGKPRVLLPYVGGVDGYRRICDAVAADDYLGFRRSGPDGERCHDGVIRRVQPDVALMLELIESLELPPMETLGAEGARAFSEAMAEQRPPGPEVGELVDGTYPGSAGELAYRLYRPATAGPHPVVVYFHGGGWVLGHATSDDPFCRDLCVRSDALVVSCDYRHAPETRFPGAVDDAFAAVRWVTENAERLGGAPGAVTVAGWSAGANLATVVCHLARDAGGPAIAGQVLVTPVTDGTTWSDSYTDNGDGFVLTAALMQWFWSEYADTADRADPRASPLHADSFAGLPPALVVTCEFDPLRDEGAAYADALRRAGGDVRHVAARGHVHTSLTAVDAVLSGASVRAEIGAWIRQD